MLFSSFRGSLARSTLSLRICFKAVLKVRTFQGRIDIWKLGEVWDRHGEIVESYSPTYCTADLYPRYNSQMIREGPYAKVLSRQIVQDIWNKNFCCSGTQVNQFDRVILPTAAIGVFVILTQ